MRITAKEIGQGQYTLRILKSRIEWKCGTFSSFPPSSVLNAIISNTNMVHLEHGDNESNNHSFDPLLPQALKFDWFAIVIISFTRDKDHNISKMIEKMQLIALVVSN